MSAHHRKPPAILGAFVLLLCIRTDLVAQSPYAPATTGNAVQQQPQPLIRKFTFKHASAADVLKILQQLAGPTDPIGLKIAVDERTNSFVFQPDDDRQSRAFEETCTLLDADTTTPGDSGNGVSISVPALGPRPQQPSQVFSFSIGFSRGGEPVEMLKQRYNELEQQAHQLSDKLKQSTTVSETQRTELQLAVRSSFEARQALQRAELADFAQRMKSMQQSIEMRDKLADKVVERRVEDLLNPNLKWDAGKVSEQLLVGPNQVSGNPARPLPPSPSPWKSAVQQATSKLLLAYRVSPNVDPNGGPKVIALIDVDYQGKQEAGDLKEEIYTWIESNVPVASPSRFTLLSRRVVVLAMMETKLRPSDLAISNPSFLENRRRILEHLRRHDIKLDSLLITSLTHMGDSDKTKQNEFELTLEGFIDAQTSWFERVTLKGKANGPLKEAESHSLQQFATPQEMFDAVEQHGKSGSYEAFVELFNEGGVRDLAGSLLMQAVMQTSIDELSRQLTFGLAEVDPNLVAFRKVLQRWLPQSVTAAQQEAMGKGLSTIVSSIGGASPDQTAMKEFVTSLRESVEGISDHRKFCIEIMQAFEKLTSRRFVYFGNADHENEWQISQFGDRAIATLIDGSPGMATTITLQHASGTWRISSLFNELIIEAQPATTSPSSTAPTQTNLKTVTRRYSVGSFVTESFFTGKGSAELKEVYDKYESEIDQSLQDLAKTVTASCTQPPKFVQVVGSTRSLLIGHNEAGHAEIAEFMRDIAINNDRIRLRGAFIEITQDEAKSLGVDLAQHVLSVEESKKLNEFAIGDVAKRRRSENKAKPGNSYIDFVAMDESIYSGTRTPIKHVGAPIPLSIAARISPATRQIQIRLDLLSGDENEQYFASRFQTLTDGQSVLFEIYDGSYWLVTADIVHDRVAEIAETDIASPNTDLLKSPAMEMRQRLQGE